jgi:phage tail tape measure protein, TP901 family
MKFALISTGIGAIVVALGMAAAYLIENWDEVKAFFLEIWESVKPYWESTTKFFSDLWQGVSDFLSAIFEPVIKIWDELFGGFFDWIAEKFGWINDMVGEAIKGLSSAWNKTKEFFGFGSDEQVSSELKPKDDSGGFFNSIFGSDSDTHAKEAPALVAASTGGGAINISFNGDFLLNSDNGKFDLESFKAQIVKGVKDALRRDEFNRKNTDVRG